MRIRTLAAALVMAGSVAPAFAQNTTPVCDPAISDECVVITTTTELGELSPGLLAGGGAAFLIILASGGGGSPVSTTSTTSTTSTVSTN